MKDITHYFTDTVKSCGISSTDSKSSAELKDASEYPSTKKRARVKIKISRISPKSRVCNIVESKNDLIDKTPSPFTKVSKEENRAACNETPKKPLEILTTNSGEIIHENIFENKEQQILKEVDLNHMLIELDGSEPERIEHKVNGELSLKKSLDKQNLNKSKMECNLTNCNKLKFNTAHSSGTEINKELTEMDTSSNAFHVLMNQNKTINYISSVHSLLQNDILSKSVKNKSEKKVKQCKEKFIAIEDKKDYSKRKLREVEEDDEIEEIVEKRMKLFTESTKVDNDNSTIIDRKKNTSSNLLQFFSKAPIQLKQEDIIKVSTIVVKADVHMSDVPTVNSLLKTVTPMSNFKNKMITNISQTEFSNIDNIDLITSEDIIQEPTIKENLRLSQQHNKPKWSLRIKLQSSKGNTDEEAIFSPKSRTKFNAERRKQYEKVHSDTEEKYTRERTKLHLQKKEKVNGQGNTSHKDSSLLNSTMQDNIDKGIIEEEIKQLAVIENVEKYENYSKTDIAIKNNSECPSIIYDHISTEKPHKKLAPLFTRQLKPNTKTVPTRRLFLQSSSINNDNKNKEKKITDDNITFLPFPKISHITQLNDEMQTNDKLDIHQIRMKSETKYKPKLNYHDHKYTCQSIKVQNNSTASVNLSVEKNIEEILTEMEKCCTDTRSMWKTVLSTAKGQTSITQSQKPKGKKRKSTGKEGIIERHEESKNKNSIWTHKYKPMNSHQIVGNEEAALQLKDWLIKWRSVLRKEDNSSGDEFYSSDCSYTSKNENNQVAVLLGPYGSGKTASVYAIAEELGYRVLEVNASSRRTGKRILKEFEEATKSHRIKKKEVKSLSAPILKEVKNLPQNSLILLEDIDLIFEEDEGFISAMCQLALNTKRPIVMTCRDVCSHLNKIAPEQNRIYFQKVIGNKVSTLLELISLAETGSRLSCECLAELLQNGDLRKALLQLQYLLVSGFTHTIKHPFNLKSVIWQDMRNYLYKPAIKEYKKRTTKSRLKNKNANDTNVTDILTNLASTLDNLSLLPSLIDINDPALDITCTKVEPSLSLTEDTMSYSLSQNISSEIAEWIDQQIIHKDHLIEQKNVELHQKEEIDFFTILMG
ncbi:hypothetical protein KPH14_003302 [Odynerus spinipes]|uniref:AAA+ ATPase domain-containing protein n=1 Tax=Odynerus spinipes TaxID=1348599 RepID=A0AAD9VKK6_9HYME|nr:hypothetical protein KPH14_003302 [Odynerus spinipes]